MTAVQRWAKRAASLVAGLLAAAILIAPVSSTTALAATVDTTVLDLATLVGPIVSPDKLWDAPQNVISVNDATCKEGTTCRFTVTLTNGQPNVTNAYSIKTVDGSAKSDYTVPRPGADYHISISGGIFAPGAASGSITFFVDALTDNQFFERNETFSVQIYEVGFTNVASSNHPPTVGRTTGIGTIPGIDLTLNR